MSSAIRWTTSDAARPDDHPVGSGVDAHPLVVLDLGHRGVDDVRDAELLEAGRPTRRTTEDHQALGRPAHAGGQVVEAEQLLEALRVFLVLLQRLDQRQLLVDQGGVAARQGDEHGADLGPQLGLTGRQGDRLLVHVVDGAGELAELLLAVHGDRDDLVGLLALPDPVDGLGQLHVGHVERTGAHPAQRVDQGTGDEQGQQQRGEQREQDDRRVGERPRLRGGGARRRAWLWMLAEQSRGSGRRSVANILGVAARSRHLAARRPRRAGCRWRGQGRRARPAAEALLEVVERRALDADLGREPHRAEQRGLLVVALDQQLLLDQRQPAVERLDQRLRPAGRACPWCSAST